MPVKFILASKGKVTSRKFSPRQWDLMGPDKQGWSQTGTVEADASTQPVPASQAVESTFIPQELKSLPEEKKSEAPAVEPVVSPAEKPVIDPNNPTKPPGKSGNKSGNKGGRKASGK